MDQSQNNWVERTWYGGSPMVWLLLPFSVLFSLMVRLRRYLYAKGVLGVSRIEVPVIVVGNISVGGTGKTPLTVWLAQELGRKGFTPGIISRGYRGKVGAVPRVVADDSDPAVVGDEPLLLQQLSRGLVVVHPDRVAAARLAIEEGADLILSDDGLQHYSLARDFEIAVQTLSAMWNMFYVQLQ